METYRRFLKAYWWDERDKVDTDQKQHIPPPPPQKPCAPGTVRIDLAAPEELTVGTMPLGEAMQRRKSHRAFTQESLTLEELAFLLWATQGVREIVAGGRGTRRIVPSAGARHPFETYLAVERVAGLEPGLYRYLPMEHQLCLLHTGSGLAEKVGCACRDQAFIGQGAVVFIWTVIPYRAEWRYLMVAPKMIALDAGHLCQNLYLASEAIGAGTCAVGAYRQDQMDALLGVDGQEEFVIYIAPVGRVTVNASAA
ncbi:MAG: SagB/ThcOx family dehydrogenase [Fidelibacterota bacterium]|nr:MAG: SagB/ThcOx family dehydrogenase [Candidatus Neomarinimicrobiota bacterium]